MTRARIAAAAIVVALVAGACGDSGPTPAPATPGTESPAASQGTPSGSPPQPSPAPTPEPTPVDASAAFVATVTDPAFAAAVEIAGETRLGKVAYALTGTMAKDGPDSDLTLTTTAGPKTTKVETLVVGDARYVKALPPAMWFAAPSAATGDLAGVFTGIGVGVTDTGVETKDGRELHHLVIPPPGTLGTVLGASGEGITGLTTTMDAWAEEDGTPVIVELRGSWTREVRGKPVAVTKALDLTFSELPAGTTIAAPDTVWQWNTSARFKYRMAYPTDWTFKKGTSKYADAYYAPDNAAVFASRGRNQGLTLGQLSRGLTRYLPQITRIKSPKVTANKAARLGPLPARRIEFNYKSGGKRFWSIMYLAVKGSSYYVVEYETLRKTTDADREMAARFASSFSPR